MEDSGQNPVILPPPVSEKPTSVTIFGVLNIVVVCYQLIRTYPGLYKIVAGACKNPEKITGSEILFLLLLVVGIGLSVWLLVLGIGLLTMKRWARRGSVLYARIQIIFMVIILGAVVIKSITEWENAPRVLLASITLNNALAVIQWIYMILLFIFMQTEKVKRAFAGIGG